MVKVNIDSDRVIGALVVLENYLDGALADFEDDMVEDNTALEDSIYVHKILERAVSPFSCLIGDEYEERYLKAKENKK